MGSEMNSSGCLNNDEIVVTNVLAACVCMRQQVVQWVTQLIFYST